MTSPAPTRHREITKHLPQHTSLATADLDGVVARPQAGGADVVQEPTEQPYGVRDCTFRDPAGIRFDSSLRSAIKHGFRIIRWHPLNREAAALTWAAE